MSQVQTCLSRTKWWLVTLLGIVIILSPMVLMPGPVRAADPYADLIPLLQQARQQLAELLATYNSMDASGRAMMDSAMASGMRQALQQYYGSLSASDRAAMDEQCRQASGYTLSQLVQGSTTVPGLVRTYDAFISGLTNLSGGVKLPPTTTTKPPTTTTTPPATTTKPPATTTTKPPAPDTPSGVISFEKPTQGGVVDFTSKPLDLKMKLGWQLFSDPNMSEAEALRRYKQNVDGRKSSLDGAIAAAEKRKQEAEQAKLIRDKQVADQTNRARNLEENVKKGLDAAKKDSNNAWAELKMSVLGELVDKANETNLVSPGVKPVTIAGKYLADMTQAYSPINDFILKDGDHTPYDYLKLAGGLVSVVGAVNQALPEPIKKNPISAAISIGMTVGTLLPNVITVGCAEWEVHQYQNALQQASQVTTGWQRNEALAQYRIDVENMKIQEYQRQRDRLVKQGGYVDPKYLQ